MSTRAAVSLLTLAVLATVVRPAQAVLVDFNTGLDGTYNTLAIPATYQPVSGLTLGYNNVGLTAYGPDHTTGTTGTNHYNTTQLVSTSLQAILFNVPSAVPSLYLADRQGTGSPITLRAYSAFSAAPSALLGTYTFTPLTHPAPSGSPVVANLQWSEFTGLASLGATIRRVEISGAGNSQVDDLSVTPGTPNSTPRIKIMPLGDSITHGITYASFRYPLYNNLDAAGLNVDFVGSMSGYYGSGLPASASTWYPNYSTSNDTFYDKGHEGHSGYTTAQIINDGAGFAIANSAKTYTPDIVTIHLGTNDIGQGIATSANGYQSSLNNLSTIIDSLRAANPNVKIALAQIIPLTPGSSGYGANAGQIPGFNTALATLAANKNTAGSPIVLVDQFTGFGPTAMLFDGIHPNPYGEQLMADRFYTAIQKLRNPSGPLQSADIHLSNASFDDLKLSGDGAVAGAQGGNAWTYTRYTVSGGTADAGVYNPPALYYANATSNGTPSGADGAQVAYIYNQVALPAGTHASIEQTIGAIVLPDTLYSLTVAVGQRLSGSGAVWGGYDIQLLAGDTVIAEQINAFTPDAGTFADALLTLDSRTLDSSLFGRSLHIRLLTTSSLTKAGTDFDNIRLAAPAVPEPATALALLAGLPLVFRRRRR